MNPLAIALTTIALPSPLNPLSATPPVGGHVTTEAEGITHHVLTTERVRVRVDRRGRPFAVRVGQRLVVLGKGDYVFAIPAPVRDVVAGPGSESTPGQRSATILWSGFNPDRKVLVADARLDPPAAAPSLPLRVTARGSTITIENVTPVRAGSVTAAADPAPLGRYLDTVRTALTRDRPVPFGTAEIAGEAKPHSVSVEAPIRVTGTIGGRRISTTLGDGHPLRLTVPRGDGTVALRADPVPPLALATPPAGASTWQASGLDGRELLARAQAVLLRIARARQFDAYLGDPDPLGRAQTTYVYRTGVPAAAAPPVATATGGDGGATSVLGPVAIALAAALAAVGGLAVWARA
jgi:hypothetical protein